jgi:hypothetical protein
MQRALTALSLLLALAGSAPAQGSFRHSFSFEQRGVPQEVVGGLTSETRGAGSVSVAAPLTVGALGYRDLRATVLSAKPIVHVDHFPGRTVRLTLRPLRGVLSVFADGSRLLELEVRVASSNDPACPVGRKGDLGLDDNPSGRDVVDLYLCPRDHEHYYVNHVRGSVRIAIE